MFFSSIDSKPSSPVPPVDSSCQKDEPSAKDRLTAGLMVVNGNGSSPVGSGYTESNSSSIDNVPKEANAAVDNLAKASSDRLHEPPCDNAGGGSRPSSAQKKRLSKRRKKKNHGGSGSGGAATPASTSSSSAKEAPRCFSRGSGLGSPDR